ncbi:hypothetical protein F5Y14DRAFT_452215 [Nemania sp. NC0429]|nr:hypothetical protein F5Y14DRAFT_452215 [Nemania sp. NC0429]
MPTPDYHIVGSACDKKLLRQTTSSDITVECGDKTWQLHRVILETRCPFFRKAAEESDGVIKIQDQDPDKVDMVINFIYTGERTFDTPSKATSENIYQPWPLVTDHFLKLLMHDSTVTSTCVDIFTLGTFFSLEGLRQRAVHILTEYFIAYAGAVQTAVQDGQKVVKEELERFAPGFFDSICTVYSRADTDDLQPLKATFLLFIKLTRYVALRDDVLGERIRSDPRLAGFLTDILKATFFRPFGVHPDGSFPGYEEMQGSCSECEEIMPFATKFEDPIWDCKPKALCRRCSPLGDERVLQSLGANKELMQHNTWYSTAMWEPAKWH